MSSRAPFLALVLCVPGALAETPDGELVSVFIDPSFSMEPGVRTLESLTPAIYAWDEPASRALAFDESRPGPKLAAVAGRALRLALLDVPIASFQGTLVHEVFGHGARAREFGQWPAYQLKVPVPWSFILGDGAPFSGRTEYARTGIADRDDPVHAGGIESSELSIAWTWREGLTRGELSAFALVGLLRDEADYLPRILFDGQRLGQGGTSSDPDSWFDGLSGRFNLWRADDLRSLDRRIRVAYATKLLDPAVWVALKGVLWDFLVHGRRAVQLPRLSRPGGWWLPGVRVVPSPFGLEHQLRLDLGDQGWLVETTVRFSSSGLAQSVGLGIHAYQLPVGPGVRLGVEADAWVQPELLFDLRNVQDAPLRFGAASAVLLDVRLLERLWLSGKLGAKLPGFLMGQPLHGGPFGYLGLRVSLDRPRREFSP